MRYALTLSYDGSGFYGWQIQPHERSIQETLQQALGTLLGCEIAVTGAGRTDTDVNAFEYIAHFDYVGVLPYECTDFIFKLNAILPQEICILDLREVDSDFHARFDAAGKVYEYLISTAPVLSPFMLGRVWHRPMGVDAAAMREALAVYEGTHDFRRFAARRGNEPENPPEDFYLRTIYSTTVEQEGNGEQLRLRFHGNGFMYRMVRMLVGTAYHVAAGKMSRAALAEMLANPLGSKTRHCAPPSGLYLTRVFYT